jgi:hypothetical protein
MTNDWGRIDFSPFVNPQTKLSNFKNNVGLSTVTVNANPIHTINIINNTNNIQNQSQKTPIQIGLNKNKLNQEFTIISPSNQVPNHSDYKKKFKTEICKFYAFNKECAFGDKCAFAHGKIDIKHKENLNSNYKTKKCKQFYDYGFCPYGNRCQFLHKYIFTYLFK